MPPITVTISGRTGTASDFIGGLCSERLVFTGDALTLPAKVALLDLDGTTLAAADLQSNDTCAVFADLSTDTQQVADRYRHQPTDTLNRATLFIGDDTTLQAVIEVQVKKNWLDDTAYHPPVRPDVYPTEDELNAWLEAAGEVREGVCTCAKAAASSAEAAASSARLSSAKALDAVNAANGASASANGASASAKAASASAEQAQAAAEKVGDFSDHLEDHANPHRVTAAQVGALTERTANVLYPRFRDEDATTTVGNNHGRNVMASQNGDEGGFYVTGVKGNPPNRKQWLTEYQRNRVRVYTATSGESKDYYWDGSSSGDAEKAILRWCDLFAQAVTTVWRGIMRMCNPRISAAPDDASKDIALVPNANGAGLQVQFPGGATAMIRAKTGTLATVAEVNEKDASTLAEAKAYADGKVVDVYRFKGNVATKEALPSSGNTVGDVWNVSEDGMNYAWTGEAWDALGASVDLSAYSTTAQADARYLKLSGGTVTGTMRIHGALTLGSILVVQNGESKFGNYVDTNNGVAYSFKASKGMFNEMAVDKLTGSTLYKYIPLIYRNTNAGTEVARVDQNGLKELHDGQLQYLADIYAPKGQTYTKTEADGRYLKLTGGTLTGNVSASGSVTISVPILEALNYFVARRLVNEAAFPYNHSIYLGYTFHDQCNFYEIGGIYNFREGGSADARIIGQITKNGIFELGTKLADKYAAKAEVYTKAEVDEKITSALGDISAALAAI